MASINLSTLFTNPLRSAAYTVKTSFKSSMIQPFQNDLRGVEDNFLSNPVYAKLGTKADIEKLAKSSPRIMELLKEHNLSLKVNMDVLEEMR